MITPVTDNGNVPMKPFPPFSDNGINPARGVSRDEGAADLKEIDHQFKLMQLARLEDHRKAHAQMTEDMVKAHQTYIATLEMQASTKPQAGEALQGNEAKQVLEAAKARVRRGESHLPIPPPPGATSSFLDGPYRYNIHDDGRITRQKADMPTPAQHEEVLRALQSARSMPTSEAGNRAYLAHLDQQIATRRSELGITDGYWRQQLAPGTMIRAFA